MARLRFSVVLALCALPAVAFADANITVDGNTSDWAGISPLATDPAEQPAAGVDISNVYVTDNNNSGNNGSLYFRDDFYGNFGTYLCSLAKGTQVQLGFGIDGDGDCQISSAADTVIVFTYTSNTANNGSCTGKNAGKWTARVTTGANLQGGTNIAVGNAVNVGTQINSTTGDSSLEMSASFATLGLTFTTDKMCVDTGIFQSPGTNGIEFGPDSPVLYDGVTNPTAVQLMAAAARAGEAGVEVRWATGSERNNLGFRIERLTRDGWKPVHPGLVAGALHSPSRHAYVLLDASGKPGDWYRLTDVEANGHAVVHTRFQATSRPFPHLLDLTTRSVPRAAARPLPMVAGGAAQFAVRVSAAGLYRLADQDLQSAGLGPHAPRLSHEGTPWPVFALDDGTGQRGFYFYAPAPRHAYDHQDTYVVTLDGSPRVDAAPHLGHVRQVATSLLTHRDYEEDHYYWGASQDPDPFLWTFVTSYTGPSSVVLEAPHVAAGSPATLQLSFEGWSAYAQISPDHRVDVALNGTPLGSVIYDGWSQGEQSFAVPAGVLVEGANVVTLTCPGVPGTAYDVNFLDRASLDYSRDLALDSDAITGRMDANSGIAFATSVAGPYFAADVTEPSNAQLLAMDIRPGSLAVGPRGRPGNREIFVTPLANAAVLQLEPLAPDAAVASAEYTIVTDSSLLGAAQVLSQARATQGLQTAIATTDSIAREFDGAQPGPVGLSRFLHALAEAPNPPRFVVLLGSANYDVRHVTGGNKPDLVPTEMIRTSLGGWAASDLALAIDPGQPLPPFAIGRIPAKTDAEARAAISKILAAENEPSVGAQVLLADHLEADGAPAPEFAAEGNEIATALPAGSNLHSETTAVADPHAEALALFNSPNDLVHFIGHGYSAGWTARSIFTDADAATLTNAHQPVLFSFTCYDGEFTDPFTDSVAGALVLNPVGGALAAIADSAAENPGDHHQLHMWLAKNLSHAPIGVQLQAARANYIASGGGAWDVPFVFNLIGDPASPVP